MSRNPSAPRLRVGSRPRPWRDAARDVPVWMMAGGKFAELSDEQLLQEWCVSTPRSCSSLSSANCLSLSLSLLLSLSLSWSYFPSLSLSLSLAQVGSRTGRQYWDTVGYFCGRTGHSRTKPSGWNLRALWAVHPVESLLYFIKNMIYWEHIYIYIHTHTHTHTHTHLHTYIHTYIHDTCI
jgi:hypothetical protein